MRLGVFSLWAVASLLAASTFANASKAGVLHVIDIRVARGGDDAPHCVATVPLVMWQRLYAFRGGPSMSWDCFSYTPEEIQKHTSARFESASGKWVKDFSDISAADANALAPVMRLYPVKARNSAGVAMTQDDLDGDPAKRDRYFAFCLQRPPVVLCGHSQSVKRLADPKSDLLPYALSVVRSIEFVDASTLAEPESAASSPPAVPR